jgi:transketolase
MSSSKTVFDERSLALRNRLIDMLARSRRGHLGSAFSVIEIIRVLYDHVLRYDAKKPRWDGRDRFVLSKGHGCMAQYVLLAEKGFFPASELERFCEFGALLGGHVEYGIPGVEVSTGSLGHGLSVAVGMALAAKIDKKTHRVIAVLGDGECEEGSVWEAAMGAAKHHLSNLTAIVDRNVFQCYGSTEEVSGLEPFADKWRSFGWTVKECDGHDPKALEKALEKLPFDETRPGVLIARTVKGKGVPYMECNPDWHHTNKISDEDLAKLRKALLEANA